MTSTSALIRSADRFNSSGILPLSMDNWFLLSNYLSRAFGSKTATPIPGSSSLAIHTIPCVVFSREILNVALATSLIGEIDDKKSGGP
jgi:hypothetical protein